MKFYRATTAAFFIAAASLAMPLAAYATASAPGSVSAVGDDSSMQPVVPEMQGITADSTVSGVVGDEPEITISPMPVAPAPDDGNLAGPPVQPDSSLGMSETGQASAGSPFGNTGVQSQHSGQYYDSMALVPNSTLERAGVTGPRKIDPLYEPGQRYITVQRGEGATSFEGQYIAATRALKLGRYAAAMEMFEKLYKKNHKDQRVLMGLAVAQQGAGFIESAARTYEELLIVDPDNADAAVNLMGLMKAQYPSVTLQNLMDLRGRFPTNPGIPAQIGLVNAEMQNYDDAIRYLEVAASMDPTNASHIYNMAIIADRKGDVRGAISLYQRSLELDSAYSDSVGALPRERIYDRLSTLRQKV